MSTLRWLWIVVACVGCATPMSALRDENHHLSQEVAELRADRCASERKVTDLEHQLALAKDKAPAADVPPALPVEVVAPPTAAANVAPDGGRIVGTTDDGGEVIYEGDAAAGKPATLDDDSPAPRHLAHAAPPPPPIDDASVASDRIEVTHRVPPRVTEPPAGSGLAVAARAPHTHVRGDSDPAADYRAAVDLVKAGTYADAITALRAFIQHYPRHDYADNAQYWIGEAFYAQKDYPHALAEFRATIETYPRGNKVPDALLKVGYCYAAMGQTDKAHAVLEQVVSLYPKSEPAALAAKRLETP